MEKKDYCYILLQNCICTTWKQYQLKTFVRYVGLNTWDSVICFNPNRLFDVVSSSRKHLTRKFAQKHLSQIQNILHHVGTLGFYLKQIKYFFLKYFEAIQGMKEKTQQELQKCKGMKGKTEGQVTCQGRPINVNKNYQFQKVIKK